jgi:hypothetical protein
VISDLVLFCGGKPIHDSNNPKPLALMPNSLTVLGNYLRQIHIEHIPNLVVLTDDDYVDEIQIECEKQASQIASFKILRTPNGSTTLEKLQEFLLSDVASGDMYVFTYPDVFFFGDSRDLFESDYMPHSVQISGVYLQTRFPEISYDPYTQEVHSVSLRPPRIPANSTSIYGGHFAASHSFLQENLCDFNKKYGLAGRLSLEGDFFRFLSSAGKLRVCMLEGTWIKADSTKEMLEILYRMGN